MTKFQKRGLPHVHILLILDTNDKLRDPKEYDSVVRAKIPKIKEEPQLHKAVLKHMYIDLAEHLTQNLRV